MPGYHSGGLNGHMTPAGTYVTENPVTIPGGNPLETDLPFNGLNHGPNQEPLQSLGIAENAVEENASELIDAYSQALKKRMCVYEEPRAKKSANPLTLGD